MIIMVEGCECYVVCVCYLCELCDDFDCFKWVYVNIVNGQ